MAQAPAPVTKHHSGFVDTPPGKDGHQGQHPNAETPPVPDYAAGTNPPGTNPPMPAQDPATTPIPGSIPGVLPEDYPKNVPQPQNQGDQARQKETATRGGPPHQ
jgi:hypothetical protein